MALGRQGGFLDCLGACDVAACDVGSCDLAGGAMDTCGTALECSTCDCSWLPWRRRRSRGDDQYVVIPARGNVRN